MYCQLDKIVIKWSPRGKEVVMATQFTNTLVKQTMFLVSTYTYSIVQSVYAISMLT